MVVIGWPDLCTPSYGKMEFPNDMGRYTQNYSDPQIPHRSWQVSDCGTQCGDAARNASYARWVRLRPPVTRGMVLPV